MAAGWVAGGLRRAVSGVTGLIPGQGATADEPPGAGGADAGVPDEPDVAGGADEAVPVESPAEGAPAGPWTAQELAGFAAALEEEITRLREELDMGEADLADLVADSGDGAGDDQADAGAKTFEREHEMSVNANIREMLDQGLRARQRLRDGTYGTCERCGQPIASGRLRAFPRATLCISCKQGEERR